MRNLENFHKILGALFIVVGIIFWITPIPGTTLLIILGFVWLLGKNRTSHFLKEILGKKIFKFLKIRNVVKNFKDSTIIMFMRIPLFELAKKKFGESETRPHSSPDPSCGREISRGRANPFPQTNCFALPSPF